MTSHNAINMRILPGLKPVLELLHTNPQKIISLFCRRGLREAPHIAEQARRRGIPLKYTDQIELDKLCADATRKVAHQGLAAELAWDNFLSLAEILEKLASAPLPLLLALDQIKDPGNLGAVARTAWALGAAGILLPLHESARPGPAALKSSAGALELLPLAQVANLAKALDIAEEQGIAIYGTGCSTLPDEKAENAMLFHWELPAILVLGSEEKGIRPGVMKRCGRILRIPLARHFDSLNIAQSGAILMGLCSRQLAMTSA